MTEGPHKVNMCGHHVKGGPGQDPKRGNPRKPIEERKGDRDIWYVSANRGTQGYSGGPGVASRLPTDDPLQV